MKNYPETVRTIFRKVPFWTLPPVLLCILVAITGYNGLYGQDSFEYLRYSRALHDYFLHGTAPGQFLWPVFYPLAGSLVSFILPDILSLQLISIICFAFSVYFIQKTLFCIFPEKYRGISVYVILFYSLSPFLLRYAVSIMTETMALFFLTGFFYFYFVFLRTEKPRIFFLLSLFAGAAINTRYACVIILIIPILHSVWIFLRNFNPAWFAGSLLAFILLFLPGIWFSETGSATLISNINYWSGILTQWSPLNFFRSAFITENGTFNFFFPNILWVLSSMIYPGFIFSGILFIVFIRTEGMDWKFIRPVIFTLILYWIFLAGLPLQNDRILLLSFPLVIFIFSGTFLWLYQKIKGWIKPVGIILAIIIIFIQSALFYRAFIPFYRNFRTTRYVAERMLSYPSRTIYTFNIDIALKEYGVKNRIINLWEKSVDKIETHSLILFNFTESSVQWQGMNPMLNWEKIQREHRLKLVERFMEGWELYEITD